MMAVVRGRGDGGREQEGEGADEEEGEKIMIVSMMIRMMKGKKKDNCGW